MSKRFEIGYTFYTLGTNDEDEEPDEYLEIPDEAEIVGVHFLDRVYENSGKIAFKVFYAEQLN